MKEATTPYSAVPVPVDGRSVPKEYLFLPEAQGVYWNDDFFDDEDGVIAVFDFDYDKMRLFNTQVQAIGQLFAVAGFATYLGVFLGIMAPMIVVALYIASLAPCLLTLQVQWDAESNHLAITRDGIRFVQDKRKSCWGFSMCDKGKHSKTVPFDMITDCDIIEPAGNQYLCFPRILFVVNVDTASSGAESNRHELRITGLKEPHKFKAFVWSMKRARDGPIGYQAPPAFTQQVEMASRTSNPLTKSQSTDSSSSGGVKGLLRSIRDELRQNNELLRNTKQDDKNNTEARVDALV